MEDPWREDLERWTLGKVNLWRRTYGGELWVETIPRRRNLERWTLDEDDPWKEDRKKCTLGDDELRGPGEVT